MALSLQSHGFSDALVILGAAGIVIPAFARLRVNPVIGFILVGILVGPHGLGALVGRAPWLYYVTISEPHGIEPFAEFGIILLLFSIGLELSFGRLWAMRARVFGLGAAELMLSALAIGGVLAVTTDASWQGAAGLALALSLSSTALVLPIAGTESWVGRAAFSMLLFEDLALVPIVFGLGAIAPGGSGGGGEIARVLATGAITVAVLLVFGRFALPRLFSQAARTKSPELFLAISLLVVILAALATGAAGLSPIVGALIAGVLIAETDYHLEVEAMTAPFKGLALGVFLITVGMSVELGTLAAGWRTLLLAVAGVVAIKALVTAGVLRAVGFRAGVAGEAALLMAAPSETTLIVLGTAVSAGLVSVPTAAFWQTVTAIGLTITPLLAEAGRLMARAIDRNRHAADQPRPSGGEAADRVVIVGFGRVGRLVAQMLDAHGIPYLAIDADPAIVAHARRRDYTAVFGDIARPGVEALLGLARARALVLTVDDPVLTARVARRMRSALPDLLIIARARDPRDAASLYKAGVSDAVPETVEGSLQLSEALLTGLGLAVGPVIASIHEHRAQLRAKIMAMAEMDREPPLRGRRAP